MQLLIGSVSLRKLEKAYIVDVKDLVAKKEIPFLFDTGAGISLIGINTLSGDEPEDRELLKQIIEKKIARNGILENGRPPKTVTREQIEIPLLGFDYIDNCSFSHRIR